MPSTYRELREKHLSIPCFDSAKDISTIDEDGLESLKEEMRLCNDLRAPYCAVWASGETAENAVKTLSGLIPLAEELGVTILIKTRGLFSSTEKLRALLDDFACDQLAVLWDVHFPYRSCGESPAQTITNLGAYVKHVHLHPRRNRKMARGSSPSGATTAATVCRRLHTTNVVPGSHAMERCSSGDRVVSTSSIPHNCSTPGAKNGRYLQDCRSSTRMWLWARSSTDVSSSMRHWTSVGNSL